LRATGNISLVLLFSPVTALLCAQFTRPIHYAAEIAALKFVEKFSNQSRIK
jgi:hypothetical protein